MMMTGSVWGRGDGGRWSDSGYGLSVEAGRCADGRIWNVVVEEGQVFSPSPWKVVFLSTEMGNLYGEQVTAGNH